MARKNRATALPPGYRKRSDLHCKHCHYSSSFVHNRRSSVRCRIRLHDPWQPCLNPLRYCTGVRSIQTPMRPARATAPISGKAERPRFCAIVRAWKQTIMNFIQSVNIYQNSLYGTTAEHRWYASRLQDIAPVALRVQVSPRAAAVPERLKNLLP